LQAAGALKVKAYATHAVFPRKNWHDFLDAGIDLYLTNSVPSVTSEMMRENLAAHGTNYHHYDMHILSLSTVIMQEIIMKP
jgi:phosphoribosylpyrophosphate synthetase